MKFVEPWWLLLLIPLLWLGWRYPAMGLARPLRLSILLVLMVVLVNPQCRQLRDGLDLWVLVDRSDSAGDRISERVPEWLELLEDGQRSNRDRVRVIDFAASALVREVGDTRAFTGERGETRVANAIETALTMRDEDVGTRLLLFSDGFSTEPVEPVLEGLLRENVPLDVRLLGEPGGGDLRLSRIDVPTRVGVGEPFVLEVEVSGRPDGTLPLEVRRDGRLIGEDLVEVREGRGRARFVERLSTAGARRYDVSIRPEDDAEPGNNVDTRWVEAEGGRTVLLLTSYENDPLVPVIRQLGAQVDVVTDYQALHPGRLSGAGLVVFNNVPAHVIPSAFMRALDFHVRQQGGALLMTGGSASFGGGGYFESPVDPLLPVSMELRSDQRRGLTALGIVMDRSGSMSATVDGGRTKMDLANEGAANAIDMLGDADMVTVWAVDTSAHEVVPLQVLGPQRAMIDNSVRRIESLGGGIYVYEGLSTAWKALRGAPIPGRPIILFSDAADSVEPGAYRGLLREITDDGGVVSVIALGKRSDKDAKLLEDIATRGNGRIYFTEQAKDLPTLFSQEVVAVARSTFIEEPVGIQSTGGWRELADRALQWPAQMDSYNLNYRREWATHAVLAEDEHASPMVSFGRRGLGRVAALASPIAGEGSATMREWQGYGDMLQSLSRWLLGDGVPPGMAVRARLEGSRLVVRFWHDDRWSESVVRDEPELLLARGEESPEVVSIPWRRINPGEMKAELDLSIGEMVRGVVQAGGRTIPFGPLVVGSQLEFDYDPAKPEQIRELALQSGGRELLDLGAAWRQPPVDAWTSQRPWWLVGLLGLVLVEALATRMGWWVRWRDLASRIPLPELGARKPTGQADKRQKRKAKAGREEAGPTADQEERQEPEEERKPVGPQLEHERRQSRFARAKGGRSGKAGGDSPE